jgi:membrane-bound metal-dependent hydrolase YbcI (DUF457 family)
MPITPFHFGPGAFLKAIAPRQVSWTAFALTNGLIDLEPILLFLFTGEPAHRFFHTLPGATLAALAAVWPGRIACASWLRFWNRQLSPAQARWLGCEPSINARQALVGALLGAWSHLILDMAMHVDVRPLWPAIGTNPWHGWMSVDGLHVLSTAAALAGLALWGALKLVKRS